MHNNEEILKEGSKAFKLMKRLRKQPVYVLKREILNMKQ